MLPLMLGKILDEERQRQIESTLQRRRWLAGSEPPATPPGPSRRAAMAQQARTITRSQDPGVDPICPTS